MPEYESEQQVVRELLREFAAVPPRIVQGILHAYLETMPDLDRAAHATRRRLTDALSDD